MTEQKQPIYTTPEELANALRAGDERATPTLDAMLANIGERMKRTRSNPNAPVLDMLQAYLDGDIDATEAAAQMRAMRKGE